MSDTYQRLVIKSVTVFIHHENDYLFLKRNLNKKVDPGKLNGIGGKLELGENFVDAAIRETQEETGLVIVEKDLKFAGVYVLEEGYEEEWVICNFKLKVQSKHIPHGMKTEDGEFLWLKREEIKAQRLNLIDDLNYTFQDIVKDRLFFMTCKFDKGGKVTTYSKSTI